ncbi:Nodulation protein NolR (fragment) [Agrobacterium tumefaciens str. Kerr 14]|uniref:Nodulation protein NolR n=1 Tax=Agrobacterium tumefaciens str. Kerr 14 TaxID=1183424 RepID=A0A1S7SE55_AGRTU
MDEEQAVKAAALCAILGNPVRLSLVRAMLLQDTSVAELSSIAGLSQSATSQHLARLRAVGLVETRRDAQTIYYRCTSHAVRKLLHVVDQTNRNGSE